MSSARKNILFAGLGLIILNLFVVGMLLLVPAPEEVQAPVAEVEKVQASTVTVPVQATGTVFAAMEAHAAESDEFSFGGEEYPGLGFFVNEIAGQVSTNENYWILYINGTTSPVGVTEAEVAPGDVVEWRFEASIY